LTRRRSDRHESTVIRGRTKTSFTPKQSNLLQQRPNLLQQRPNLLQQQPNLPPIYCRRNDQTFPNSTTEPALTQRPNLPVLRPPFGLPLLSPTSMDNPNPSKLFRRGKWELYGQLEKNGRPPPLPPPFLHIQSNTPSYIAPVMVSPLYSVFLGPSHPFPAPPHPHSPLLLLTPHSSSPFVRPPLSNSALPFLHSLKN
jgi:hypothetical protein